ncbi:MAG: HAMP domain-containing histidine kinase [Magnetococcales bacterium]|nr:HAMP domain-containing histidine kinase [Magnetococcales bacterium]
MEQYGEEGYLRKSNVLSCICHDLRSSVHLIEGFGNLLIADETMDPEQQSKVELITRHTKFMLGMLEELEQLARMDYVGKAVAMEKVSLGVMVQECVEMVSAMAEEKGLRVTWLDSPGTCPVIKADPIRLRQVLLNLLINAIKYNRPQGEVAITWAVCASDKVRLFIHDTGMGIPDDRRHEVFRPFSRLGREHSPVQGSGLGLAIAKELVALMGGDIGFDSIEGKGTTFWLDLKRGTKRPAFTSTLTHAALLGFSRLMKKQDETLVQPVMIL